MMWKAAFLSLCSAFLVSASQQNTFTSISSGFIPEGKGAKQGRTRTLADCQSRCEAYATCKAFAFETRTGTCFFYPQVYMGGNRLTRAVGLNSCGLSIVEREGFVSAFKRTSFPKPPTMIGTKHH